MASVNCASGSGSTPGGARFARVSSTDGRPIWRPGWRPSVTADKSCCPTQRRRSARSCCPRDIDLFELGRYHIRGFEEPVVLHSVVATDLRSVFPPPRTSLRGLDELPADDSTLIGREQLIEQADQLVREHPVVTLWGPGGVGKSRAAVRVAGAVRRPFAQGVRFVDLSTIEDPDQVCALVVSALRAQPTADERPLDTVLRVLCWARLLLVLDNCEHVLDEVRTLVSSITEGCPGAHVLATSREVIGVEHEATLEVRPLATPPEQATSLAELEDYPSVRLFVERARTVDPSFHVDAANGPALAALCRATDGLPLALELAAARMDVETVEQIGTPGGALVSRLTTGPAAARRLQSLKTSFEWSYQRLAGPDAASAVSLRGVCRCVYRRDGRVVERGWRRIVRQRKPCHTRPLLDGHAGCARRGAVSTARNVAGVCSINRHSRGVGGSASTSCPPDARPSRAVGPTPQDECGGVGSGRPACRAPGPPPSLRLVR